MVSEEEIKRLHRARKTVLEILRDRGYDVTDVEIGMSFKQFTNQHGGNMKREDLLITKTKPDGSDKIYVFFVDEGKKTIGVEPIRYISLQMKHSNVYRAILAGKPMLSSAARAGVTEVSKLYHLEDFLLPRIQVTNPVAKYYGLIRGDVVKIIRLSETAGRYVTYRYVV